MYVPSSFASLPLWVSLPMLALVAAYFLQVACNTAGADSPTFRKSLIVTCVAAAAGFFLFDVLGYFLMLGTRDMTHLPLPPGFGYLDWLKEPTYLKWQVMGLVPVLRYLPLLFAVCLAGVLYVLMLREEWRIVMVIFLMQWVLAIIVSTVMAYALSNVLGLVKPVEAPQGVDYPGGHVPGGNYPPRQETRASQRRQKVKENPDEQPPAPPAPPEGGLQVGEGTTASLKDLISRHSPTAGAKVAQWTHQTLDWCHELTDPLVKPVEEAAEPYTKHLPLFIQEFLEDGGWLFVILGITVTGLLGIRSIYKRFTTAVKRKQKRRKKAMKSIEIDLDDVGDAMNDPGKNQITVRDLRARIRLVIIAPAASYVGDLLPEMAESLLDWIKPGLGAVYEHDTPRVLVWPRFPSEGRFLEMVQKSVKNPDPRGRKTPWIVMAGTTQLGRQRVYLCVAVHLDKPGYVREIRVSQSQWSEVLGIAPSLDD